LAITFTNRSVTFARNLTGYCRVRYGFAVSCIVFNLSLGLFLFCGLVDHLAQIYMHLKVKGFFLSLSQMALRMSQKVNARQGGNDF
jgi:hypothetical protein